MCARSLNVTSTVTGSYKSAAVEAAAAVSVVPAADVARSHVFCFLFFELTAGVSVWWTLAALRFVACLASSCFAVFTSGFHFKLRRPERKELAAGARGCG